MIVFRMYIIFHFLSILYTHIKSYEVNPVIQYDWWNLHCNNTTCGGMKEQYSISEVYLYQKYWLIFVKSQNEKWQVEVLQVLSQPSTHCNSTWKPLGQRQKQKCLPSKAVHTTAFIWFFLWLCCHCIIVSSYSKL